MAKVMLFIDGTWLYASTPKLGESYGKSDYHVDFRLLPRVLADEVGKQLGAPDIDVVRTYLFGSYPANYDLRDDEVAQRRHDFFSLLKEEYHYEVEVFPIDFRGRRLRKADRDVADPFEPKEKCVDIALATSMLFLAAMPHAYDVALAVLGDQDFKPVLQHVRLLGKRVAIASIRGCCSPDLADPADEARVKDFDLIWLDDHLQQLELKFEPQLRTCESPLHKGDRKVWDTYRPRKGQKFFCKDCRTEFARQKQDLQRQFVATGIDVSAPQDGPSEAEPLPAIAPGQTLTGMIKRTIADRGFGFIDAFDHGDYYFHFTDLEPPLEFAQATEGLGVTFEVKRLPANGKAGAAQNVRRQATSHSAQGAGAGATTVMGS
jgi:cold shock CspA family protein